MSSGRSSSGNSDREYLDAIAFVEVGKERKKKPRTIGYAWTTEDREYGKQIHIQTQLLPVPGNGWDGTIIVQKRRERDDDDRDDRRSSSSSSSQQTRGRER